ncbi:glycosyltransferase [Haliovirga abyssi]|uniref:OmpA-like domain-containing protein n=1 Tax=Haliovirga abyssi TaxID=2996794 RepID=A0AAU9DRN1_9FUSO|nr:glycosyltransferase [Haliovirga abyssi]BDU51253.1 hypothetical protein HLVA_18220 [Haliovirga abyssi]
MEKVIFIISIVVITYFILINLGYILLFITSYRGILKYKRRTKLYNYINMYQSNQTPPISLLVPAYNEEAVIIKNINAFLNNLNYPEYEIIVINDGSKDETLKKVLQEFKCEVYSYPYRKDINTKSVKRIYRSKINNNLIVVDKENGGKADALNVGINISKYPYFGSIDADTILERDSYLKVITPILSDPKRVIATGGIVGVVNGCKISGNRVEEINFPKTILAKFQVVEYLRAFMFGRYAWALINALPIISGAFGLFKKSAVILVGGYSSETTLKSTVGEDMELVIRLHKYFRDNKIEYKISFVPEPLSWTEVPEDIETLKNQRSRWHRGLIETLASNKDMFFKKRYGTIGFLSFPYYYIFELLAPIIELMGYLLLPYFYISGMLDRNVFVLFFSLSILLGVLISGFAVFLEMMTFRRYKKFKDNSKLFFYGILENFGYRQMLLLFKLNGFFQYILKQQHWGIMKRKEGVATKRHIQKGKKMKVYLIIFMSAFIILYTISICFVVNDFRTGKIRSKIEREKLIKLRKKEKTKIEENSINKNIKNKKIKNEKFETLKELIKKPIYFKKDSVEFLEKDRLSKIAKEIDLLILKKEKFKIKITGYADKTGNRDYNLKLSLKRAEKIGRELLLKSVYLTNKYFILTGKGEENITGDNRTLSRRVELEVVEYKKN